MAIAWASDQPAQAPAARRSRLLADELAEYYEPEHGSIEVDGRDLAGTYLLACVMNLRSLGPALQMAPDACFDDGLLDVVPRIRPEHRADLHALLRRGAAEGEAPAGFASRCTAGDTFA